MRVAIAKLTRITLDRLLDKTILWEMWKNFVIQRHTHCDNPVHWDLMLELENTLETYRLEIPPDKLSFQQSLAVKIADHQLKFLTYEGPVNKGSGSVEIAERGKYRITQSDSCESIIEFDGIDLKGVFRLQHIEAQNWRIWRQEN